MRRDGPSWSILKVVPETMRPQKWIDAEAADLRTRALQVADEGFSSIVQIRHSMALRRALLLWTAELTASSQKLMKTATEVRSRSSS